MREVKQRLSSSTSLNVSYPQLPKTTTVTHFTPINTIRQRAYKLLAGAHRHPAISPSAILPAAADERLQSPCRCARPRHQRPASPKTAKTSPSEGRGVTGSPSHTEYGGPSNQSHTKTGQQHRLKLKVSRLNLIFEAPGLRRWSRAVR